jgi:hypothetical protein
MTFDGNWTLHFGWGSAGNYGQSDLVLNGDGTFGGQFTGKWHQRDGTLMLSYDTGPAKYGGTVTGSIGSGLMSTFEGLDGCWYLSKEGTTGILPERAVTGAAAQPAGADGSVVR